MGALGSTNVSLGSAEALYGASSTATVTLNDTNMRYLAGKPQSASGTTISFSDIASSAYIATSSGGASVDVRAAAVAAGWNGAGPVWFVLNGNTYSGSTGTASLVISGSFPKGLIVQINAGVVVSGKGGAGGAGSYGTGGGAGAGGPALSVSGYSGGTLYINNLGTLAGGGGGGGGGAGSVSQYVAQGYFQYTYASQLGGGGGGGSGVGAGGSGQGTGQAGTISAGGAGVTGGAKGGNGGGPASSGQAGAGQVSGPFWVAQGYGGYSYYSFRNSGGGAAGGGACTTGTVAASAVWINTGTRYGTIG